jgi:Fur family peroxide stress response transcriptional regulator
MNNRSRQEIESWCSEFVNLCRSRGIKVTAQRLSVYRALAEDLSHPSADAIFARLKKTSPTISQATVYRTLEFLAKENLIRRVSGPESLARFDANLSQHQHLFCRECGKFSDISLPDLVRRQLPKVTDFIVEDMDIRLVGLCSNCSHKKSKRRSRK